jgi:hypothetical protein
MRRIVSLVSLTLALLSLPPLGASVAHGAEPGPFVRLYYSHWMKGEAKHSPADPQGAFTGSEALHSNPLLGIELIVLRRVGLSFVRQKLERGFMDATGAVPGCVAAPCAVSEQGVEQSLNLTLYAGAVAPNQFNAFLGGGSGTLDYRYDVDGVRQTHGALYEGLSLSRGFAGFDWVFERVGVRLEVGYRRAHRSLDGQRAEVDATYQHLTLIIPLN